MYVSICGFTTSTSGILASSYSRLPCFIPNFFSGLVAAKTTEPGLVVPLTLFVVDHNLISRKKQMRKTKQGLGKILYCLDKVNSHTLYYPSFAERLFLLYSYSPLIFNLFYENTFVFMVICEYLLHLNLYILKI